MKTKLLIEEAWQLYKDWEKRKSWGNGFVGRYTTPEEDKMAIIIIALIRRIKL